MSNRINRLSPDSQHLLHPVRDLFEQPLSVTCTDRERIKGQKSKVIWLTGLPGSGKSTLANLLEGELNRAGRHTYLLDGDNLRLGLNIDLGFSVQDRAENIRRVAEVARLMKDAGLIVITALVSPIRKERDKAKQIIGPNDCLEVYISTPLEICESRDSKGLYKRARAGLIPDLTGINSPYEAPTNPALEIDCSALQHQDNGIRKIIDALQL